MPSKKETLPPHALAVMRHHQADLGRDLAAVVEAVFRLAFYMGRAEGHYMHLHHGQAPRGKAVPK